MALAKTVLPTPGTSSISRWPPERAATAAAVTAAPASRRTCPRLTMNACPRAIAASSSGLLAKVDVGTADELDPRELHGKVHDLSLTSRLRRRSAPWVWARLLVCCMDSPIPALQQWATQIIRGTMQSQRLPNSADHAGRNPAVLAADRAIHDRLFSIADLEDIPHVVYVVYVLFACIGRRIGLPCRPQTFARRLVIAKWNAQSALYTLKGSGGVGSCGLPGIEPTSR